MSNISRAFENKKAFVAFITCGDPDIETTERLIVEMANAGVDLIELGIPFSDPTAEGIVIQSANERALSQGITTDKIFDMVERVRSKVNIPIAFMTYANVVFSYPMENFLKRSKDIGIDGLILPDVPYEEKDEFEVVCQKYGIDLVSLIAPTSKDRIATIAKNAKGFIYCVSSLGVTGVRSEIKTDVESIVNIIKENSSVPCAVGFGISTAEQAKNIAKFADGVIIGSAIVKLCEKYKGDCVEHIVSYVKEIKEAIAN